jgi:FtsP/CotA-like multicopper oxidase with cupredoxin domain
MKRRELLKAGMAAGGAAFVGARLLADNPNSALLKYLCPPDGALPDLAIPSPKSAPFAAPLKIMPIKKDVTRLDPPPDPLAHQLYDKYPPKKFYEIYEQEFKWIYHPDPPYGSGTWSWGFGGPTSDEPPITPGPTYDAHYGEPILVRRYNNLPTVGNSKVTFALPSTTSHLHNGHTASESDGNPQDWIDSGEFWDHHYCNFPADNNPDERLHTLWYHDHRMDFTASNVYAGLSGIYRLFDDQDTGDENTGWRLPSGDYDVPMLLHDVLFDQDGQVVFDPFNTDGILGDKYTVNRTIQPRFEVKRRKYRVRIVNGGPSRFYRLFLKDGSGRNVPFRVITGDGNFLTKPLWTESVYLSVAQRVDLIIDFSRLNAGDHLYLWNGLLQTNGRGPTTRMVEPYVPEESVMRFDVTGGAVADPSRVPASFRNLPKVDLGLVRRRRTFDFDYNGGLWTVNGQVFDPNRIDAKIEQGTAEIWTLRNQGKNWSHPIHSHFTEYILLQVNGVPLLPVPDVCYSRDYATAAAVPADCIPKDTYDVIETGYQDHHHHFAMTEGVDEMTQEQHAISVFMGGRRRDIATLNENDELVVYMAWHDFLGKHVMHCHNVVHEDHAMMIRWDIVKPGQGDKSTDEQAALKKRKLSKDNRAHVEPRPNAGTLQNDQNPPLPQQKQPTSAPPVKPPGMK